MDTKAVLNAALRAAKAGVSVVPPAQDGTKKPIGTWKEFQSRRASEGEIREWYATPRTGVGFVCGAVSGGLTAIDFDDRSAYRQYKSLAERVGLADLLERVEAGYYEESPNGAHLLVQSSLCERNKPLAVNASGKRTVETRGEGGYIIVAPTFGGVNPAGPYTLKRGGVETIVTLDPEELQELLRLARLLDVSPHKNVNEYRPATPSRDDRPGDDYNERARWADVLEPHGWTRVFTSQGVTHWRRPGKTRGTSATTGYAGTDYLYVFSSSTDFEPERGYSKFSAYALLRHGGDHSSAASELSLLGYGREETEQLDVDISALLENLGHKSSQGFPAHLLNPPGGVGWLADWILRTSPKPQPILALGASLAAWSTAIGRKARTSSDLRSNVYILGVGESGCGKERARQAIRTLFLEAGAPRMASVDSIASGSAIETTISREPSSLFLIDELGLFLQAVSSSTASGHLAEIKSVLLRLYSASQGPFRGKTHANPENDVEVQQPCLSLYGTTTPRLFLEGLGSSSQAEGFFSRLLVFESEDPDPEYRKFCLEEAHKPPRELVSRFKAWVEQPISPRGGKGNLDALERPDPLVVPESPDAERVFDEAESRMRDLRAQMRLQGDEASAYVRVVPNARKLALIRACGECDIGSGQAPEITEDCADWAVQLAEYLTSRLLNQAGDHSAETEAEKVLKAVLRCVKKGGSLGVKKRQIVRATQQYTKRARDEALHTLVESGQVVAEPDKRTPRFRWAQVRPRSDFLDSLSDL